MLLSPSFNEDLLNYIVNSSSEKPSEANTTIEPDKFHRNVEIVEEKAYHPAKSSEFKTTKTGALPKGTQSKHSIALGCAEIPKRQSETSGCE